MAQGKIALLYICTGSYVNFWEGFYHSFEELFIPEMTKEYFVFTDAPEIEGERENERIHRIPQEDLGWPGNTLYRFRLFLSIEERLRDFDYCFYINANTVCTRRVAAEDFLPDPMELTAVRHPYFLWLPSYELPYERRRKSRACIPWFSLRGKFYAMGGVQGGRTDAFLRVCRELDARIAHDERRGVVAVWNDESHWNWYLARHRSVRLLGHEYGFPEKLINEHYPGWDEFSLLIREKNRVISLPAEKRRRPKMASEVKQNPPPRILLKAWEKVKRHTDF